MMIERNNTSWCSLVAINIGWLHCNTISFSLSMFVLKNCRGEGLGVEGEWDEAKDYCVYVVVIFLSPLTAYFVWLSAFEGGGSPSVGERESAADQILQRHDHKERHTGTAALPRLRPPATSTSPVNLHPFPSIPLPGAPLSIFPNN